MYRIRTTKTGSKNTAVQIVARGSHNVRVVKHIGTAHDATELRELIEKGRRYIAQTTNTPSFFPELFNTKKDQAVMVNDLEFTNAYHNFAYEFLSFFYEHCGFIGLSNDLLKDLVIMRIIEPCSKLRSIKLLKEYFGKNYGKTIMYDKLRRMRLVKTTAEQQAIIYAKEYLSFDFSIVFYDVTTLYFESFKEDGENFKKPGFSKDNKANQPQIVIGLIVTKEGFPVSYEVFAGNTFEGKTFIPTIVKFKKEHGVKNLTVVADAAMISFPNVQSLIANNLSYIVGARTANLKLDQIREVSQKLNQADGVSIRTETERGLLVCDFSLVRYRKDKREMEKQITKAEKLLQNNDIFKRTKFIKTNGKTKQSLNQDLIEKTKLLLGIKGYYTNLTDESDETIIKQYHSLWHVEQAFRIAKSDLEARPIFHHKRESIETHILIVFIGLCIAKTIELSTRFSIKKVKDMIWGILDIEFIDTCTKKEYTKRMTTKGNKMVELLSTLRPKN